MRKTLLALLLALLTLGQARAELYLDAPPAADWESRPLLRLIAFDVDQADCMLLECGGERMMVDGGSAPFREPLRDALEAMDIHSFKYLLNTHFHDDHITGLIWLMKYGFEVGEYLHPYRDGGVNSSDLHRQAIEQTKKHNIPNRRILHGDTLRLGDAELSFYRWDDGFSTNARSLITHVRFGESTLLLPADIVGQTQHWCVENLPAEVLDVDILKAPHHGITPMVPEFLEMASPDALLMTTPHKRVDRGGVQAEQYGKPTFYAGDGHVVMETDGKDWYVYQQEGTF